MISQLASRGYPVRFSSGQAGVTAMYSTSVNSSSVGGISKGIGDSTVKYSMFFYRRSLARANRDDLRKAAEAVVDAALLCNATRGCHLVDPSITAEAESNPLSDQKRAELREQMIEAILNDPARTSELFRS